MQPNKTGDQPYSDASPFSECSLVAFTLLANLNKLNTLKSQQNLITVDTDNRVAPPIPFVY